MWHAMMMMKRTRVHVQSKKRPQRFPSYPPRILSSSRRTRAKTSVSPDKEQLPPGLQRLHLNSHNGRAVGHGEICTGARSDRDPTPLRPHKAAGDDDWSPRGHVPSFTRRGIPGHARMGQQASRGFHLLPNSTPPGSVCSPSGLMVQGHALLVRGGPRRSRPCNWAP